MSGPGDPHVLNAGHAPTPFTAEEIREGCPQGRTIRLSVDAGGGSYVRVIRFATVDDAGANQESLATTPEGEPLGDLTMDRTSWSEFQEHASFPRATTTIDPEALNTPMGRLECRVYTVRDGESVTRFWFAVSRPGMPVKVETRVNDEVTYTMTMIEDRLS